MIARRLTTVALSCALLCTLLAGEAPTADADARTFELRKLTFHVNLARHASDKQPDDRLRFKARLDPERVPEDLAKLGVSIIAESVEFGPYALTHTRHHSSYRSASGERPRVRLRLKRNGKLALAVRGANLQGGLALAAKGTTTIRPLEPTIIDILESGAVDKFIDAVEAPAAVQIKTKPGKFTKGRYLPDAELP